MANDPKPEDVQVRRFTERFLASLLRGSETTVQLSSADPLPHAEEAVPSGLTNHELIACIKEKAGLPADPTTPLALGQLRVEEEGSAGTVLLSCEQLPDNGARLVLSVLREAGAAPEPTDEPALGTLAAPLPAGEQLSQRLLVAAESGTLSEAFRSVEPEEPERLAYDLQTFQRELADAERWSFEGPTGAPEQAIGLLDPCSQAFGAWLQLDPGLHADGRVSFSMLRQAEGWRIELRPAPGASLASLALTLQEAEPAGEWTLSQDECLLRSPEPGSGLEDGALLRICRSWLQAVPLEAERSRRAAALLCDWPELFADWQRPRYRGCVSGFLQFGVWRDDTLGLLLLRPGGVTPAEPQPELEWRPLEQLPTRSWRDLALEAWWCPHARFEDLSSWRAARKQLPISALLAVMRELARSLEPLHNEGRGHGALHPGRVWLSSGPGESERPWLLAPTACLNPALDACSALYVGPQDSPPSPAADGRALARLCLALVCGQAPLLQRAIDLGETLQPAMLDGLVTGVGNAWYGDLEELLRGMLVAAEPPSVSGFVRSLEESAERWEDQPITDTWMLPRSGAADSAPELTSPQSAGNEELAFLRAAVAGLGSFDDEDDELPARLSPVAQQTAELAARPAPVDPLDEDDEDDEDAASDVIEQAWEALGFDEPDDSAEDSDDDEGSAADSDDEPALAALTAEAQIEESGSAAPQLSQAGIGSSVFTPQAPRATPPMAEAELVNSAGPPEPVKEELSPQAQAEADAETEALAAAEAAEAHSNAGRAIKRCLRELPLHDGHKLIAGCVLSKRLGRRGGAAVYRGTQLVGRHKVLLTLLAPVFQETRAARRFLARAERFEPLKHPNLLGVLKTGNEGGLAYIVQQRVRHLTARELVESIRGKERLGMAEAPALAVTEAIARGLAAMHEQRLLHAKVHPGRILIPARQHKKRLGRSEYLRELRDTKLALISLTLEEWRSQGGDAVSWRSFLAPERSGADRLGPTADVYSLGAVLFFLLTGRAPVQQPKGAEASPSYLPLYQLRPQVSMEIGGLLARCLQPDPSHRFKHGRSLLKAVEKVRRSLGG